MRWDEVVVTPYLGPVGLALYVLSARSREEEFHQRAQAATKSALKPIAQRSVHPRSALNRPPSARAAFSPSTISPPTPKAASTVATARMESSNTSGPDTGYIGVRRSASRASVRHRTRYNPRANLLSFKWERASRRRDLTAHPLLGGEWVITPMTACAKSLLGHETFDRGRAKK